MNLLIRPAQKADAEVIGEYNRRLARETEHRELEPAIVQAGVKAMLDDPFKGRYFVAEVDGQIVGQLGITCEWSDWRNGFFWWIQSVYVSADSRRQGVFRQLFDHVIESARAEKNVIGVRLYVEADNDSAAQTYRRLGLEATSYRLLEKCW
jgi:GNAT superfamily N-acetyltransferase